MSKRVIFSALLTLGLMLPAASALAVPPAQLAMAHHDTTMNHKQLVLGFYKDILNEKKHELETAKYRQSSIQKEK